jgi:hypothetical protein
MNAGTRNSSPLDRSGAPLNSNAGVVSYRGVVALCAASGALAAPEPAATPELAAEARNPRKRGTPTWSARCPRQHRSGPAEALAGTVPDRAAKRASGRSAATRPPSFRFESLERLESASKHFRSARERRSVERRAGLALLAGSERLASANHDASLRSLGRARFEARSRYPLLSPAAASARRRSA